MRMKYGIIAALLVVTFAVTIAIAIYSSSEKNATAEEGSPVETNPSLISNITKGSAPANEINENQSSNLTPENPQETNITTPENPQETNITTPENPQETNITTENTTDPQKDALEAAPEPNDGKGAQPAASQKNVQEPALGPNDAVLEIQLSIDNKCQPKNPCAGIDPNDFFRIEVDSLHQGTPQVLEPIEAPQEGLSYVFYYFEGEEIIRYVVEQKRKNFDLVPWQIQDTNKTVECQGTIKAGDDNKCGFTFTLVNKDYEVGQLKVITKIVNECLPKSLCSNIHANTLFSNHIFTLIGNSPDEELEIPASENGWNVQFFPTRNEGVIQYDVRQSILDDADFPYEPWQTTYSPGCQDSISKRDSNTCIITNIFGEGNLNVARLNITTEIQGERDCEPLHYCANMQELFSDHVYTLERNKYEKKVQVPASEEGWTVKLFPAPSDGTIQYNVKQIVEDSEDTMSLVPWKVTYSRDCQSTVKAGETKSCVIRNSIVNQEPNYN